MRFIYTGIRVRNLSRSVRFYRRLGFRVVQRGSFPHGGRYVHLAMRGSPHRLELNFYPRGSRYFTPYARGGEFDHLGFHDPRPDAWLKRVMRAGGRFALGYADPPRQQLYFVRDPDGLWLGVFGPLSASRRSQAPLTRSRARPGARPKPRSTGRQRPARSRAPARKAADRPLAG